MAQIDTNGIKRAWPTLLGVGAIPCSAIMTTKSLLDAMQTPHLITSMSVPYIVREFLWLRLMDMKDTKQHVQYVKTSIGPMPLSNSSSDRDLKQKFIALRFGN